MPRENSFDDEARSLTPDLEDELERERNFASMQEALDAPGPSPIRQNPPQSLPNLVTSISRSSHHVASPISVISPSKSLKSHKSQPTRTSRATRPPLPHQMTPKDRFRSSVKKVIQMRRMSSFMTTGRIGAEPGVDPRRNSAYVNYGHIRQKCLIDIIDYSATRASFGRMTNGEFVKFLDNPEASTRDPWVKVRWINVGGVSWDVVSAIALKYDIHPLALEDVLHDRHHARSKADYFPQHLFLRVLCHTVGATRNEDLSLSRSTSSQTQNFSTASSNGTLVNPLRTSSPEPLDDELGIEGHDASHGFGGDDPMEYDMDRFDEPKKAGRGFGGRFKKRDAEAGRKWSTPLMAARRRKDDTALLTLDELKKRDRVNVRTAPMCVFLFRDGTVISIHPDPNLDFTSPISSRIRQRDTTLRSSADASLLVESLLDLIVDQALEVVDEYHDKINVLEREILIKPKVKNVRDLHILSGDLILYKRTLGPVKTVIYGLRRYDVDRCAALIDDSSSSAANPPPRVVGFMSHKSKIYLADVHDHMEHVMTSLDMYAAMSENLINYTFNMASYEMNEVMRRLTLATIIFLPLTLLTGYFGMNFESMWSIQHGHTDLVFWIIALPVMAIVVPIFITPDLKRIWHYMRKKWLVRGITRDIKRE